MGLGPLDVWAQAIRPIDHNIDLLLRRRPTNDPCLADIPPPYIYTVPRVIWQVRGLQMQRGKGGLSQPPLWVHP